MPLTTGQQLSFYEILGPLGAGGMGEVYLARDTRLEREVAIKVLSEEMADDEERLRRFDREAKTLASLNHPNVAGIHGIDQEGDTCFLAMELVPGEDLEEKLKHGALPLVEALDVCRQIAEGLEAAHEAGVVHRDLKPANVRITPEGAVKILDFGLAKPIGPKARKIGSGSAQSDSFLVTSEGMILGTPTYMSPEQARGKPVDRRTDIWAFGCVLFECLTGKRAFKGDAFGDLIVAILEREVNLAALPAETPPRVRELIARCLVKDPRERLRDLGEARIVLGRARSGEALEGESGASQATQKKSLGWPIAAALVMGGSLALGAAALSGGWSSPEPRLAVRTSIDLPHTLTLDAVDRAIALSPDGSQVALVAQDALSGLKQIYLRSLDRLEVNPLAGTEGASYPFWSPDGKAIGFFADLKLKRIDLAGGIVRTLCDAPAGRGADWSQHGFIVFAPSANGALFEVLEDGGEPKAFTTLAFDSESQRLPHFLPDGRGILYSAYGTTTEEDSAEANDTAWTSMEEGVALWAFHPDTRALRKILDSAIEGFFVEPGFLVYVRDSNLMLHPFDPEALELTGDPEPIATDVHFDWSRLFLQLDIVASGTLVYGETPELSGVRLGLLDRQGKQTLVPAEPLNMSRARLSPDGLRAAASIRKKDGSQSVVLIDLERGIRIPVNPPGTYASHAAWSGDGKRLALETLSPGLHYQLSVTDARPGAEPVFLTKGHGFEWYPDTFTPDGQILFSVRSHVDKRGDLMLVKASGDSPISPFLADSTNDSDARMSPDGKWVVFASFPPGADPNTPATVEGATLSISEYPSKGRWQITRPDAEVRTWGWLSEREIYWQDAAGEIWVVSITPRDGNSPSVSAPKRLFEERIFQGDGSRIVDYSVTREQFLVAHPADPVPPARLIFVSDWNAAR